MPQARMEAGAVRARRKLDRLMRAEQEVGQHGRAAEFRRGWRVIVVAASGCGVGVAGLFTYNSGLFVKPLEAEIGLGRTAYGLIFFGATVAMVIALPVVGRWIDRRGPRLPALSGALALAGGFACLGLIARSVAGYAVLMLLLGLLAAGSTPIAYNRAVSAAFRTGRGLALGLTQVGIGISAAIVPPLVTALMIRHGWQAGFLLLAAIALLGSLPALSLKGGSGIAIPPSDAPDFRQVARSRLFLLQMACFVVMALGFAGLLPHFVPMLRDAGLSAQRAAAYAGLIGLAVIFSRVIVGWLADRMHAPLLAAAACLLCGAGCLVLAWGGAALAPVGAVALGCAMGAEADLIGFLTARHFGLAVFGRAYARQYAAFMLAAGAGPAWVGFVRQATGGYAPALVIAAVMLALAAGLFLMLPRVPEGGHPPA